MKKVLIIAAALLIGAGASFVPGEPGDQMHVLAIGVDADDGGGYVFSFLAPGESHNGDSDAANTLISVSAESFGRAEAAAGSYLNRKVNVDHAYLILFSREAALRGLAPITAALSNRGVRPLVCAAVTDGRALDSLRAADRAGAQSLPGFLSAFTEKNSRVFPRLSSFYHLYPQFESGARAAVLPYFSGGDTPKWGMAIIKDLTGAAFLGEEDAFLFAAAAGLLPDEYTCADEVAGGKGFGVYLKPRRSPEIDVDVTGSAPEISVRLSFDCRIICPPDGGDERLIAAELERLLERRIGGFLYRTAREYNADVLGIYERIAPKFPTLGALDAYGFYEKYRGSVFRVTVKLSPGDTDFCGAKA
ncbi:MAG: hypothetical protein IKD89_04475 [Clostridia bacterium]|nr:hypothetical protein [Clostridia bacterium]